MNITSKSATVISALRNWFWGNLPLTNNCPFVIDKGYSSKYLILKWTNISMVNMLINVFHSVVFTSDFLPKFGYTQTDCLYLIELFLTYKPT